MGEFAKITVMSRMRTSQLYTTSEGTGGFNVTVHSSSAETEVTYLVGIPSNLVEPFAKAGHAVDLVTGVLPVACAVSKGLDSILSCGGNGCTCNQAPPA
jgi:hypothetical protein